MPTIAELSAVFADIIGTNPADVVSRATTIVRELTEDPSKDALSCIDLETTAAMIPQLFNTYGMTAVPLGIITFE